VTLKVAMLGDIVGRPGRLGVAQLIPTLRRDYGTHVVIANAENAASGSGLTPDLYRKLCAAGVDGLTMGDHVYRRIQIVPVLETQPNILRPANLPRLAKGRRWMALRGQESGVRRQESGVRGQESSPAVNVYVFTVLGRVYATLPIDEPFAVIEEVLAELPEVNPIVIVEVHAEATAEKQAIGWHLDGRVAAVLGTHSHVQTADACILPKGTAYITDVGMCGPRQSIIGRRIDRVLSQMTTGMPISFDVAEGDPRVCGAVVEIDPQTRRAVSIEPFDLKADPNAPPFTAERPTPEETQAPDPA
jgi:metallophosphoesterase (TIGR00282 family)